MNFHQQINRRRALYECSECYQVRLVGHMFTRFQCSKCGIVKMHGDTAIPKICDECCKENKICCRCGKELD